MSGLLASPYLLDLLLAGLVVEAAALIAFALRTDRGVPPRSLVATLAAGGLILFAWKLSVGEAWWGWVGLALAGAFAAHVADLALRWRR